MGLLKLSLLPIPVMVWLAFQASVATAQAADWRDRNGTKIKGQPVEVMGPFALFRDSAVRGNRVLLRGLAPEDCVRFYRETAERAELGPSLAAATGAITRRLSGGVQRVRGEELVPADLSAQAEPELLVVLFGHPYDGKSWAGIRDLIAIYHRLKRVYGDRFEFLYFGPVNEPAVLTPFATSVGMPWLIADRDLGRWMGDWMRLTANRSPRALVVSRDGAPVLSGDLAELASRMQFVDQLGDLVGQLNPANPRIWKDRQHYFGAIRSVQYPTGEVAPQMIGNPLRPQALREYGVKRIAARLSIDELGVVTNVEMGTDSDVPPAMITPLAKALERSAMFLPAMRDGGPVAGSYDYHLVVPVEDPVAEADAAWLSGEPMREVILNEWLGLRPIMVPESEFADVAYTNVDGVMVLAALEVADTEFTQTEQLSAFSSNWFDAEGAGAVNPRVGDQVEVRGKTLRWEPLVGERGFIDFQKGLGQLDYTIGYAWIEFEMPKATEAWLGIGSDDGLKIWHNGELAHDKWIRRNSLIDDDIVPLNLTAGRNTLLVKIQNAWGDWSFISRLRFKAR